MSDRHIPGNAGLVYFTVTCHLAPIVADLSQDSDYDPNTARIDAVVTFTPKYKTGEVIHSHTSTPPTGFLALPVTALIDDGYLKLRARPDVGAAPLPGTLHGLRAKIAADTGVEVEVDTRAALNYAPVRLLGNSTSLEIDPEIPLYYDFSFSNIKIDGKQTNIVITGGTFEAPWEDTVIDLLDYMPLTPGPYAAPMVVGPQGPQGIPGPATVDVGTTTTLEPGTEALVVNDGDNLNALFSFQIPRGEPGPPGASLTEVATAADLPAGQTPGTVFLTVDTGDLYRADGTKQTGWQRISDRVASTGIEDSSLVGQALVTAPDELAARAAIGSPLFVDVASAPYNVTPTTTNPEVKIQEAIDFAAANGIPEVIISRPGTYTVGLRQIPGQTSVAAAFWGRSNLKLTMKPGVVIKLKDQATLPSGSTQGHVISVIKPFTFSLADVKTGWSVEGGVIDGNAANQSGVGNTPNGVSIGLFLGACRSSVVRGVKVINIWGNNTVPPGETFFFEANSCRDVAFVDCEADGSGSVNTATGFSANNSFGVSWTDCVSHDMGVAMGFTAWQCAGLRYSNCHAYSNGAHGFNSERNDDVVFTSCVAGGSSPFIGYGTNTNPWFQGAQQRLGNGGSGFAIHGCENVSVSGCVSTYNTFGLKVYTNQLAPLKVCKQVNVTGCVFKHSPSEQNNIFVESTATPSVQNVPGQDQVEVHITDCLAAPNNAPDYISNYSDNPIIRYNTKSPSSGVRYWTTGTGGWAYRWQFGANPAGPLPAGASVGLTTGHQLHTAGRRLNRKTVTANYSLTTQDEVVAVDTTNGSVAVNLSAAANYGAGATLLIKDEAGKAGEPNKFIVINALGPPASATQEYIEGSARKLITTNYGQLRIMSTGTGWVVIDTLDPAVVKKASEVAIPGFDIATKSRSVLVAQEYGMAEAPNIGPAGAKRVVTAEAYGAGVLENIWYAGGQGGATDRSTFVEDGGKIRIYLDDSTTPAVDMPINDFFCYGARGGTFNNERVGRVRRDGASSAYRNLYAPFRAYMRVEWENTTATTASGFFSSAQYKLDTETVSRPFGTYKIVSNKATVAAYSRFTIADISGAGQIESIYVAVDSTQAAEMGFLEGNPEVFVDGETVPAVASSGAEDFFHGGWYAVPVSGYPAGRAGDSDITGTHCALYRFFPKDPIRFNTGVKVVLPVGQSQQGTITPATLAVAGSVGVWLDNPVAPKYSSTNLAAPVLEDAMSYTGALPAASWVQDPTKTAATGTGTTITIPYGTTVAHQDNWLLRKNITLPSSYWVEAKFRVTNTTNVDQEAGIIATSGSATAPTASASTRVLIRKDSAGVWKVHAKDQFNNVNWFRIDDGTDLANTWLWLACKVEGTKLTAYYKIDGAADWHPIVSWTASAATVGGAVCGMYAWTGAIEFDRFNVYPLKQTAVLRLTEAVEELTGGVTTAPGSVPVESWTNAEIKAYADAHRIDLGGATKKADMLAAIKDAAAATIPGDTEAAPKKTTKK